LIFSLVATLCSGWGDAMSHKRVMPWMCLERCGENITFNLQQIQSHLSSFTAVSFEDYDLGEEGNLVNNNFTSVNGKILSWGLQAFPMITTVSIHKLRVLFQASDNFIEEAIEMAISNHYTGYNIDFEPTGAATEEDAAQFAVFLTKFADALHSNGKLLSVDVASWSEFWDFHLLGQTSVDTLITMDTYTGNVTQFQWGLERALKYFGPDKMAIGLDTEFNLTTTQLNSLFEVISQYDVNEIDIWDLPIQDNWWTFINSFVNN